MIIRISSNFCNPINTIEDRTYPRSCSRSLTPRDSQLDCLFLCNCRLTTYKGAKKYQQHYGKKLILYHNSLLEIVMYCQEKMLRSLSTINKSS